MRYYPTRSEHAYVPPQWIPQRTCSAPLAWLPPPTEEDGGPHLKVTQRHSSGHHHQQSRVHCGDGAVCRPARVACFPGTCGIAAGQSE
eukprot:gene11565-biopygen508